MSLTFKELHDWKTLSEEISKLYCEISEEDDKYFSLEDLARSIKWAVKNSEHISIVIDGKKGHGKTTLAAHIAAHTYTDRWGRPRYKKALEYLFFDPVDALVRLLKALVGKEIVEVIIFDDAGSWLSKWSVTKDKRAFFELSNLFRQVVACCIYTDVASIAKYMRLSSNLRIRVKKLPWSKRRKLARLIDDEDISRSLRDPCMKWSEARIYHVEFDLYYNTRFRRKAIMLFPVKLPKWWYPAYNQVRREYTAKLLVRTIRSLLDERPELGEVLDKLMSMEQEEEAEELEELHQKVGGTDGEETEPEDWEENRVPWAQG